MSLQITFELSDTDLTHYRLIMKQARLAASRSDPVALLETAKSRIRQILGASCQDFIRQRLEHALTLCQLVADTDWLAPDAVRQQILSTLAYFSDENDLIPDDMPGIGLIDDAIIIDLALTELADELRAYELFCRRIEARRLEQPGEGAGSLRAWIGDLRTELRGQLQSFSGDDTSSST